MFDGRKYITRKANSKLPMVVQDLLWEMIERARDETELDYLQVYDLKPHRVRVGSDPDKEVFIQKVMHHQEQPHYSSETYLPITEPISDRVFIIDSGEYSTLLMADEY